MATGWRDILPKIIAERDGLAVSSVSPVSLDTDDVEVSNEPNGPNGPNRNVSAALVAGIQRFRSMRSPLGAKRETWDRAVHNSMRLFDTGWAEKALALGWSPLELFGCVPDPDGDPAGDGLAVWLQGRPILAICETYAAVEDLGGRSYYNRRQADGAVFIWNIGRGRRD